MALQQGLKDNVAMLAVLKPVGPMHPGPGGTVVVANTHVLVRGKRGRGDPWRMLSEAEGGSSFRQQRRAE